MYALNLREGWLTALAQVPADQHARHAAGGDEPGRGHDRPHAPGRRGHRAGVQQPRPLPGGGQPLLRGHGGAGGQQVSTWYSRYQVIVQLYPGSRAGGSVWAGLSTTSPSTTGPTPCTAAPAAGTRRTGKPRWRLTEWCSGAGIYYFISNSTTRIVHIM